MLFVAVLALASVVVAWPDEFIRCKVCERAVEHVFAKGAEMRKLCKATPNDDRCSHKAMVPAEEMLRSVCDELPMRFQGERKDDSAFQLAKHDNPTHEPTAATAIRRSCLELLREQADMLAKINGAGLTIQKTSDVVLPALRHRFCRKACDPTHKRVFEDEL